MQNTDLVVAITLILFLVGILSSISNMLKYLMLFIGSVVFMIWVSYRINKK
jgi:hypothetical protein